MISDWQKKAYEANQRKAELTVQGPNELVVEEPKVASEADAIVGLLGALDALVTPAAKTKAATPGDSTPAKHQKKAELAVQGPNGLVVEEPKVST